MTIIPFQGPTFERGEASTAIDYILTPSAERHKLENTEIIDRQFIRSDHNILQVTLTCNGQPSRIQEIPKPARIQRLREPLIRQKFQ